MATSIRPLGEWVVIRPLGAGADEVESPIEIIEIGEARNRVERGVVLRVGPGRLTPSGARVPVALTAGDVVAYFSANHTTAAGEQLRDTLNRIDDGTILVRERDLLYVAEAR